MKTVVIIVENCRDTADALAIAPGQEEVRIGVEEERMESLAEQLFHIANERRHPKRILPVDGPGESDEFPKLTIICHACHCNRVQNQVLSSG